MPTALKITNLVKSYGSKPALRSVNITVEAGEIYGFLGPNGAGKTTTIRCIMDFIRPNRGSIQIFGKNAQNNSVEVKHDIGFLPAENQLYDKWTVAEHIDFVIPDHKEHALGLAKQLELDLDRQVRHLSTGNKQKIGLILALAKSPRLLILDEPTQGLDPLLQHKIYEILRDFAAKGGTVFLSSHNLAEVERICTNVGIIRSGEIVASKSMDELRTLTTHIVAVTFGEKIDSSVFETDSVSISGATNGQILMKVRGDLNPLLKRLAQHDISDLEITHAPLEDVFMEYYRTES